MYIMFPGQYYCETCYVAACGKRCAGCGQVILGEGLKFGEERWETIQHYTALQHYNNTTTIQHFATCAQ